MFTFDPHKSISSSSGEYHLANGLLNVIFTKPRLNALNASSMPLFKMKSEYKSTNSCKPKLICSYLFYSIALYRQNHKKPTWRFCFVTGTISPPSFKLKLTTDPKLSVTLIWNVNMKQSSKSSSLPVKSSNEIKLWCSC